MKSASLFFITFSIILLGYCAKMIGIVKEDDAEGLTRIILNITLPAVVLKSLRGVTLRHEYAILPAVVIVYALVLFGVIYTLNRKRRFDNKVLFHIALLGFNIGLFAYPLIEALWGARALTIAVLIDSGNAIIIFGLVYMICVYTGTGAAVESIKGTISHIFKKLFTFVPFIMYFAAIGISIAGIDFPGPVDKAIEVLARANMALVLPLLGITFSLSISRSELLFVVKVLFIRYIAGGAAGIALFFLLPFSRLMNLIILVCLVLPAGMAIIPYSIEFKYNRKLASAIVNISNLISFGLIFLIARVIHV